METDWRSRANCVGVSVDLFFPVQGEPIDGARACCAGCVVSTECLDYAMTRHITFGMWGGKSERERRRLRKERRLAREAS